MYMTTRKDIEQALWNACDSFRGKIDSSRYKDYILSMLFVKYLSDVTKEKEAEYNLKYEGDKDRSRQQTRSTIDIVIVVLIITIREHEGHHQVDASGEVEHGVVKQLFHDYFLIRFFLFLAAKLQKNIQKGCVKFEN